jgi:hypothetical protein
VPRVDNIYLQGIGGDIGNFVNPARIYEAAAGVEVHSKNLKDWYTDLALSCFL